MLSTNQQLRYGAFTISDGSVNTTGFTIDPEKTDDGRATANNVWSITVEFVIYNATDTSPAVRTAIAQLTHQGQAFRYTRRGVGVPEINTATMDVAWGPTTRINGITIIGAELAVRFSVTFKFAIPACLGLWGSDAFILSYSITHEDELVRGFQKRSARGTLRIANNRRNPEGIEVRRDINDFRDQLTPKYPETHRFEWQRWTVSPDGSKLEFGWTLEEMPRPLPAGVHSAKLSDSVSSSMPGLAKWTGRIDGTYEMYKGYTGELALMYFTQDVIERITERAKNITAIGTTEAGKPKYGAFVPLGLSATNPDVYGMPVGTFSFEYSFAVPVEHLWKAVNLWQKSGTYSFKAWQTGAKNAHATQGVMRIYENVIYDPCYGKGEPIQTAQQLRELKITPTAFETVPKPSPESSWIFYECSIVVENDSGTYTLKTQPTTEPDGAKETTGSQGIGNTGPAEKPAAEFPKPGSSDQLGGNAAAYPRLMELARKAELKKALGEAAGTIGATAANAAAGGPAPEEAGSRETLPKEPAAPPAGSGVTSAALKTNGVSVGRARPSTVVYLVGRAIRAGYEIPPPTLLELDGLKAEPASRPDRGEGFVTGGAHQVNCVVYEAAWRLRYILGGPVSKITPPANPTLRG